MAIWQDLVDTCRFTGSDQSVQRFIHCDGSDALLMFIARGAKPDKYREHVTTEHTGSIAIIDRPNAGRKRLIEMRRNDSSAAG